MVGHPDTHNGSSVPLKRLFTQIFILAFRACMCAPAFLAPIFTPSVATTTEVILQSSSYTFSSNWRWTADPASEGYEALSAQGDTLTIAPINHAHYTNVDTILGAGIYSFKVKANSRFVFSWRISTHHVQEGTALVLQNEGDGKLSLSHFSWYGYIYGWHNAMALCKNTVGFAFAPNRWHEVEINDTATRITIIVDGQELPFFKENRLPVERFLADIEHGYVGIGGGGG